MIYLLESKLFNVINEENTESVDFKYWGNHYLQYIDTEYIVKKFFPNKKVDYKQAKIEEHFSFEIIENICNQKKYEIISFNVDVFNLNFFNWNEFLPIVKKYKDKIFFVVDFELSKPLNTNDLEHHQNLIVVSNSLIFNTTTNYVTCYEPKNFMHYYIVNALSVKIKKEYFFLWKKGYNCHKIKKYNFFNNIHKPHRLAAYHLIKNNNLLDEGFFSYLDSKNFISTKKNYQQFIDFFGFENENEYQKFLMNFKIPYICDRNEMDGNRNEYIFMAPPQFSWQSYISIISESDFIPYDNKVSISEKTFKPFLGFNIPLIYGQKYLCQYLTKLGFDLFDDIFDNSETNNVDEMFSQLNKNLSIIKNTSLEDWHKIYVSNLDRIMRNYEILMDIYEKKYYENVSFILKKHENNLL